MCLAIRLREPDESMSVWFVDQFSVVRFVQVCEKTPQRLLVNLPDMAPSREKVDDRSLNVFAFQNRIYYLHL